MEAHIGSGSIATAATVSLHLMARAMVGLAMIASSGCAAIGGDVAYSAIFRISIEDASSLSADELQELRQIKLYSSDKVVTYVSKGEVKGLSCKLSIAPLIPIWHWKPAMSERNGSTPEEVAMTQLKIKALRAGGNAVLSTACSHNDGLDWGNNCFESWTCAGKAVRVD